MVVNYKTKIILYASTSRLIIIATQLIANLLIPDHEAEVFVHPKGNSTVSQLDKTTDFLLGGFIRWDAQYFMHIAKYGYTYENTLAFFPLYPLITKVIAEIIGIFLPFLNENSILLIAFIVLNFYLYIEASLALFDLSALVLTRSLAYKSALLFCFNPSTIFFVAPYTECLFSYLTFKSMLICMLMCNENGWKKFTSIIRAVISIGLSTSVRSNGILNIGFIVYFLMQDYVKNTFRLKSIRASIVNFCKFSIILFLVIVACLIPFVLVQMYDYYQFCTSFKAALPNFIINFGITNNLVLPGEVERYKQSWCFKKIPLAYSYIQDHYWNVGFLKYFELKQIPNFLLASPIIYIILSNAIQFFVEHKNYCLNLGIFEFKFFKKSKRRSRFNPKLFVFISHAVFLTFFCFTCIHVQVTTRMLCSASPILYWFCSYYYEQVKDKDTAVNQILLLLKDGTKQQKFILLYFLIYSLVGTVLFCNFLPWT